MEEEKKEEAVEAEKPAEEAKPAEVDPAPAKASAEVDWKDLYARLKADFENYKKRAAREREDTYRYAEADILGDILPTVDNLELALGAVRGGTRTLRQGGESGAFGDRALPQGGESEDPFVKGVKLVYDTLVKALKEHGAESFDSIGQDLDTEKMEAIATLPSADFAEGKVSNEVKKGWMLKGKVLRAAQVVVASAPPENESEEKS